MKSHDIWLFFDDEAESVFRTMSTSVMTDQLDHGYVLVYQRQQGNSTEPTYGVQETADGSSFQLALYLDACHLIS